MRNMTQELQVLKFVCQSLDNANVQYMLTGSFAANFYATPRMTRDIDIVVEILEADLDKFLQIFQKDFYIDKSSIQQAINNQGMFNIIHYETVFKVDFIVRKDSSYRTTEFHRRNRILLDNIPISIVSPEDLIISKLYWAKDSFSEIQLNDVKNLLLTLKDLDKEYLNKWVGILQLDKVYEKVTTYV
jgi:hypothetical protein